MSGTPPSDLSPRVARVACAALLVAAIVARAFALSVYGAHHADEAFQYLEQAHRLVFGYGIVPWEYRYGMRSWLVPLLLAVPMKLGAGAPWPEPILFARLLAAALSFAVVPAAWAIGARVSRLHGVVAMAVAALWFESVYFTVHVLTEVLATAAFLSGAAVLAGVRGRRADAIAGALFALTVVLRFHYGPAVAVFALLSIRRDWRRWGWMVAGAVPVLGGSAAIDLAMGAVPFGWIAENFRQNIVRDRAAEFGIAGPLASLNHIWVQWSVAVVPIVLFFAVGARRYPALAAAALVNLLVHMAIGHKEYRFVFLTVETAMILAAIGSVDYARRALTRWSAGAIGGVTVAGWLAASLILATTGRSAPDWRMNADGFALATIAGRDPALCGIALKDIGYWQSGGYAFLHRDVPIYFPVARTSGGALSFSTAGSPGWNRLIAPRGGSVPPGYAPAACHGKLCLYRRAGGCAPNAAARYTRLETVLRRYDF